MVSFCRFLTSLLVMTTMAAVVVAQDATPTTTNTPPDPELLTKCSTEFNAILVCLTANGVNGTNFDDASVTTTCNQCFETTQSLGQSDVVGKPCTEVQGPVDDALVECAPQCQLEGCTKEITDVMGCLFKHSAECVDGVVSPMADVVDDGKKDADNSPVSGGGFVSGPSVVASGVSMLVSAIMLVVVVVA
jgi:hypothetical protein